MKNKFRYKYDILYLILPIALLIICIGTLVINVLKLFSISNFVNASTSLEITYIIVSVLGIIFVICCLFGKYKITDKISLKFGPFDCMHGKYKVENVIKIVQSSSDDKLYVNVYLEEEPQIILINIRPKDFDAFIKCIKSKNPKVLFDKADIEKN